MTRVTAYFYDLPDSELDKACRHIFEGSGAKELGAGTMMIGPAAGERDVEYDVPDDEVAKVKQKLIAAGFRLTPTA